MNNQPLEFDGDNNIYQGPQWQIVNHAARLISANLVDDETGQKLRFNFIPGHVRPNTPVPTAVVQTDFVQALIADGSLTVHAL